MHNANIVHILNRVHHGPAQNDSYLYSRIFWIGDHFFPWSTTFSSFHLRLHSIALMDWLKKPFVKIHIECNRRNWLIMNEPKRQAKSFVQNEYWKSCIAHKMGRQTPLCSAWELEGILITFSPKLNADMTLECKRP